MRQQRRRLETRRRIEICLQQRSPNERTTFGIFIDVDPPRIAALMRATCYRFVWAVSQVQATVQTAIDTIGRRLMSRDAAGDPTGEVFSILNPDLI